MQAPLVIVGGSAAGLAAAWAAALGGADVTLLEAKAAIGAPASPAALAFDHLWPAAIPRPASCVARRHDGLRVQSPGGHGILVDAPLSIFDRGALDRHLAQRAEQAGARIETGVAGLTFERVRAMSPLVLFADGARSLAHGALRGQRDPAAMTWGGALAFEHPGAHDESRVTLTFGEHARGGRSQMNPLRGESWTHWTFFRGAPEEAQPRARAALALDARLRGWDPAIAERARWLGAAPDPVYTIPGTLVADGILLAGGAAGQGGLEAGLAAGWLAGETAARALAGGRTDARALASYERAWRARYQKGYLALRALAGGLARLDDPAMDRLMRVGRFASRLTSRTRPAAPAPG